MDDKQDIKDEVNKLKEWLEKHEALIELRTLYLILNNANVEESLFLPMIIASREVVVDGSDMVCNSESL